MWYESHMTIQELRRVLDEGLILFPAEARQLLAIAEAVGRLAGRLDPDDRDVRIEYALVEYRRLLAM